MRVALFVMLVSATAHTATAQHAPQLLARLDSALIVEERAGFSGVVLVASGDSVLFEKAYGAASRAGVPPSDLAFWLASDSKQVTAAAVLKLQERGRLSVTDSIARFFPDAPADKRGITIHHLLTHTSGLPHEYSADGVQSLADAVKGILRLELKSPPGQKYSYSNDGYTLLAAIAERASTVGFDRWVQDSLFAAAGLSRAGLWGHERAGVTIAASPDQARVQRQRPTIHASGRSVANWGYRGPTGVYSSARDMQRWIQSLRTGRVLAPASFQQLIGRHVMLRSDSTGQSFSAYGWGTRVERGADVSYAHAGNEDWLGHNAILRFTPSGDIVIVLSNSGDVSGSGWSSRVNRTVRSVLDARR